MVNNQGIIIRKLGHKEVRKHDYDVYKKGYPVTPKEVVNIFDLGFLGIETDFHEQLSSIHNKKRNLQQLSKEQKENNKIHTKKKNNNRAIFVD